MVTMFPYLRRIAFLALTALLLLAIGGCMTDGKNDPLPVKSRDKAEYEVRALIDLLVSEVGSETDPSTVDKRFRDCTGRNGESADDGRFDLSYSLQAPVPRDEYNTALRKLKKKLKGEGFKITGYREGDWRHILLYAKGGNNGFFVSIDAVKPPYDRLVFSVNTPCLLPPEVEQEQVSAPVQSDVVSEPPAVAPAPDRTLVLGGFD